VQRTLAEATLLERRRVARDTWVLDFEFPLQEKVRPGQFAMVLPRDPGCLLPRPFSILDQDGPRMSLLVKEVGIGSRALSRMEAGESVQAFGPLGSWFDPERLAGRELIMVAGGVGLVPLHRLRRELLDSGGQAPRALFGARSPEDLPRELLEGWEQWVEEGAEPGMGEGLVTRGLEAALEELPDAVVACCGPTPMMKAAARMARACGRACWLCLEEQMGCGAGVCRACVVPAADQSRMRTVCKEGPVFDLDEIDYV
jgi:dihydroorotate dehydrogenase electron transfer subunit